jgi:uncharacterized protein (DUF2147 family)
VCSRRVLFESDIGDCRAVYSMDSQNLHTMRAKIAVLAMLAAVPMFAQNSAIGLWKNVDANRVTFIRTYEEGGKLLGKVEKVLTNDVELKDAKCAKCKDENKDKPMTGLRLIWDMQKDGDKWTGGKLLDPESGRIVNCKIETVEGGKKLIVKGSVSILSKTQTWTRTE